jgi:hypothetical protein
MLALGNALQRDSSQNESEQLKRHIPYMAHLF